MVLGLKTRSFMSGGRLGLRLGLRLRLQVGLGVGSTQRGRNEPMTARISGMSSGCGCIAEENVMSVGGRKKRDGEQEKKNERVQNIYI